MELNMRRPKVTGDSYRDYKKYLEIQKMNNPSSGNTNTTFNNILNSNSNLNNPLSNTLQRQTPSIYAQYTRTNSLSRPKSTLNVTANLAQNQQEESSLINITGNMNLPSIKLKTINNSDKNSLYTISTNNNGKEIDNLKILLSKSLQNQNEMKNQIIEYNKSKCDL